MKPLQQADEWKPQLEGGGRTAARLLDLICHGTLSASGFHLAGPASRCLQRDWLRARLRSR